MFDLNTIPLKLQEAVSYSRALREAFALTELFKTKLTHNGNSWDRFDSLAKGYRLAQSSYSQRWIASAMKSVFSAPGEDAALARSFAHNRWADLVASVSPLTRSLVLKAPQPNGEKGVLFLHFEYNWLRLLLGISDLEKFAERYTVIYSTSWSPTDYSLLGAVLKRTKSPVYVQPCNSTEVAKLHAFHPRIRCVPGLPCDWLNPDAYTPRPWAERDIDLLIVSNWAPFKRHWELFATLRHMSPDLKVVCVGQPEEKYTIARIKGLQQRFGVRQDIQYFESIPIQEVISLQCRTKVAAIFSLWEGCCVAAAEALLAGAALGMREDAFVGPVAYVNKETGCLFNHHNAAQKLTELLQHGHQLNSRAWAIENIAYPQTTRKLNQMLQSDSLAANLPWTQDICPMQWQPYAKFTSATDQEAMQVPWSGLHQEYPNVFPPVPV